MRMAGILEKRFRRVGRFQHRISNAILDQNQRTGPVLQLDETAGMKVATLRVLAEIDRNTRDLEHVHAGEPRIRLDLEHPADDGAQCLGEFAHLRREVDGRDRKSTRLNSSHANISYAVFCLKKKKK